MTRSTVPRITVGTILYSPGDMPDDALFYEVLRCSRHGVSLVEVGSTKHTIGRGSVVLVPDTSVTLNDEFCRTIHDVDGSSPFVLIDSVRTAFMLKATTEAETITTKAGRSMMSAPSES